MKKPDFLTPEQAVAMIKDGSTLVTVAMTLSSSCETILSAIEKSFLEEGQPKNLTLVHSAGSSDKERGIQHLAHKGLIKRVIGGHWGLSPKFMDLICGDEIEAYCLPQGQMANLYHSMALREPGKISKIGLHTFVDPRVEGGKMNPRTQPLEDLVEVIEIAGEEYLMYKHFPIDTLLIRGTYVDEAGNLSTEDEAMCLEVLPAVMATKRWGGKVIIQAREEVKAGSIHPKKVAVPGVLVDAVVLCTNPQQDHRQTSSWFQDDSYSGRIRSVEGAALEAPFSVRKVVGRRAVMELHKNWVLNVGTGIPNDVVGAVLAEEGVSDEVMLTIESGIYGGIPKQGIDFGIACNPIAIIEHDRQFEYYNGAGIDITFMGAGEMDGDGNVNATKMGGISPGAGGFVDITSTAKNIVFCSTFTGGGLQVDFSQETGAKIVTEGRFQKLVAKVEQISYNAREGKKIGQNMFFVTERAVFKMTKEGPLLIEIAKGIDLEKDILNQMGFVPKIAEPLGIINPAIYRQGPFGFKAIMKG